MYWILCTYTQNRRSGETMQSKNHKTPCLQIIHFLALWIPIGINNSCSKRDREGQSQLWCGSIHAAQLDLCTDFQPFEPPKYTGVALRRISLGQVGFIKSGFLTTQVFCYGLKFDEKQFNHIHRLILSQLADSSWLSRESFREFSPGVWLNCTPDKWRADNWAMIVKKNE